MSKPAGTEPDARLSSERENEPAIALGTSLTAAMVTLTVIEVEQFVDQFNKQTDLQKNQFANDCKNESISVSGIVNDVKEVNTFDETSETSKRYYKVITDVQNTKQGNPYEVVLIYKDFDKVKDVNKGQKIEKEGKVLMIIDQRLYLSIWVYEEDLTPEEKAAFK